MEGDTVATLSAVSLVSKSSFLFSFLPITISNGFARQEEV